MQPGEGELHLRFDTDRSEHAKTGRVLHQLAQQCGLADPGFSPHHQDGALTVAHVGNELLQDLQLDRSGRQPGGAGAITRERSQRAGQETLVHNHHAAASPCRRLTEGSRDASANASRHWVSRNGRGAHPAVPDPGLLRPRWNIEAGNPGLQAKQEEEHDNRTGTTRHGGRAHARRRPRRDLVRARRRRTSLRHRLRPRVAVGLRRRGTGLPPSGSGVPHPPSCRPHR